MRSHIVVYGATTKSCDNPFVFKNEIERKDFQEIARLVWAHETRLQQFHPFFITTNVSNKSGNLLFAQSEPNGIETSNSDTVLVQEARLRRADASEAGALPGAFWRSGTAVPDWSRRFLAGLVPRVAAARPSREPATRLRLLVRTFAGSRTHLQLARIGRTPERVPRTVFATQREALEAYSTTCASCGAQKLRELLQ
jgi:hypothetical protein